MTRFIRWGAPNTTRTRREYWLSYALIIACFLMCVIELETK